ncbi:FAD/NAD(P)-binding protein [Streptomyces sp. NPDC054841]
MSPPTVRPSVAIVGAGPRGTGLLERLAANTSELYRDLELDVHLVDPLPPSGRRTGRERADMARGPVTVALRAREVPPAPDPAP